MQRFALAAAVLATLAPALPASAADQFRPPEGCDAFLTVQSKGCSVSLAWRCDVAPGNHWEAVFGRDGIESVTSYSDSYQWLDGIYTWDNSREEFNAPATDPIDIDELIETGVDTYDFTMSRSEPGETSIVRMVGADQLSGKTATIDGHVLDIVQTELQILGEDGTVEYHSKGFQFMSRDLRQFFLGPEQVFEPDGAVNDYDGSPVDIILPGEPGFGDTMPQYECDEQEAGFVQPGGQSDAG